MKHFIAPMCAVGFVAPHTGAWIETCYWLAVLARLVVAPHTGAWIETNCSKNMGV